MPWSGQDVGRCRRIWVLISTTRAAILMRRKRSVSNCATAKLERFRHGGAQAPHEPVGAGTQEQPELVGRRSCAGGAVCGKMRLPRFDVVFGRAAPAVEIRIERLGLPAGKVGDDEAGVGALGPTSTRAMMRSTRLQLAAPTRNSLKRRTCPSSPRLQSALSCGLPGPRHACAGSWWAPGRG